VGFHPIDAPRRIDDRAGAAGNRLRQHTEGTAMSTTTLVILIVVLFLLFGGGGVYYVRRR
jgi:hypothetical protein